MITSFTGPLIESCHISSSLKTHINPESSDLRSSPAAASGQIDTPARQPTPLLPLFARRQLAASSAEYSGPVDDTRSRSSARRGRQVTALDIDLTSDRERFGLDALQVEVEVTPTLADFSLARYQTSSDIFDQRQPSLPDTPAMSNQEQGKLQPPGPPYIPQRNANLPPPSSRLRNPAPPSPLSRIQTSGHDSSGRSLPTPSSSTVPPSNLVPQSPCFIHSHLDRSGSLQDWLQSRGAPQPTHHRPNSGHPRPGSANHVASSSRHPRIPPHQARQVATQNQPQALSDISSAGSSRVTSPIKREPSLSGYESDKSSQLGGSAVLDGDFMDDEDDTGSLTRQLAETAQGVREMSKQLGRTRVRSRIQTVLIVTKARDNRLIKLTRELALYLMQKRPMNSPDGQASASTQASFSTNTTKAEDRGMIVYVDAQLRHSKRFDAQGLQREYPDLFKPVHRRRSSSSTSVNNLSSWSSATSMSESRRSKDEGQLRYWTSEMCSTAPHLFDFVVTLGGDGTVLFTSWLFQKIVPPVLPFALGSLGFLTNFDFAQYKPTMDRVIDDGIRVNLRMRFTCTVYRAIAPEEAVLASQSGKKRKAIKKPGGEILMSTVDKKGWEALEGGSGGASAQTPLTPASHVRREKEIMCFSTRPVEQFEVLNDLVVDRGPSPFVSLLELFGDEHHLTTVQADGLTVSTPTGSTAYSLSAGGSLVHPQIPALLITPICPHTLSFRPMLLPDSMELRICVPYNSRSTAWASFDGRGRVELKQGDHIKVTASKYPFPTVCADKASTDWFNAISRTLRWNEREKQKSFVVVEEDNEPMKKETDRQRAEENMNASVSIGKTPSKPAPGAESEESDSEEEAYDIDDKSGGDNTPAPNTPDETDAPPPLPHSTQPRQRSMSSHKSGVDTPDRFMTHYEPPHAVSQRHLVDKLHAAEVELGRKENEDGQRDHIRSETSEMRVVDGQHMIPSGRNLVDSNLLTAEPEVEGGEVEAKPERTPKAKSGRSRSKQRRPEAMERRESKAKAFAFFGQDDSASDQSDEESPP